VGVAREAVEEVAQVLVDIVWCRIFRRSLELARRRQLAVDQQVDDLEEVDFSASCSIG
jgi:hypothetical protein